MRRPVTPSWASPDAFVCTEPLTGVALTQAYRDDRSAWIAVGHFPGVERCDKMEGVASAESPVWPRIGRVAAELKMRRRRLDAYQRAPDWPGKAPAWRSEASAYDQLLLLAASMLDVPVPQHEGPPLAPERRALLEDRLSQAGLDVWAPRVIRDGGCY